MDTNPITLDVLGLTLSRSVCLEATGYAVWRGSQGDFRVEVMRFASAKLDRRYVVYVGCGGARVQAHGHDLDAALEGLRPALFRHVSDNEALAIELHGRTGGAPNRLADALNLRGGS